MKTAKLPQSLKQQTIRSMRPGEIAWTMPWAMYADENEDLWVNGKYPPSSRPGGTVCMKIVRTDVGVKVYRDTIGDHQFSPSGGFYIGGADPLPVEWA